MKIRTNSRLFVLPLLKRYNAIVLGRNCFIKGEIYSEELIEHELIHQEQMNRVGVFSFYMIYLKDYLWNLMRFRDHDKAYEEIPFEKEAYARQSEKKLVKEFLKSNSKRTKFI